MHESGASTPGRGERDGDYQRSRPDVSLDDRVRPYVGRTIDPNLDVNMTTGIGVRLLCKRQLDPAHAFASIKVLLRIAYFQTGQSALAVVVSGDAFKQMFRRDRCLAERNAQSVHLGVVTDLHSLDTITFAR